MPFENVSDSFDLVSRTVLEHKYESEAAKTDWLLTPHVRIQRWNAILMLRYIFILITTSSLRKLAWLAPLVALAVIGGCGAEQDQNAGLQPKESKPPESKRKPSSLTIGIENVSGSRSEIAHATRFTNIAPQCQVDFTYQNGAKGKHLMVEATGGGCGWLDYDCDGQSDLYLVQGGDPTQPDDSHEPSDRLFRNAGDNQFEDVTEWAGISETRYGQGIAVGDYDNDGFDDIFVTNVGRDSLYHNEGDGTFTRVETSAVSTDSLWSSCAAWGDIDRDGDLDLYVGHYCEYDPLNPKPCTSKSGRAAICHPKDVDPCPDEFYLNQGDGTFQPAAAQLGLFGPGNRALGVVIADFDNNSWPDIYVANDTTDNFFFISNNGQKFEEKARLFGGAVNINGSPQASMGIAVGDYDGNGFLDIYLTHFHDEWNTLLQNLGPAGFHDVTAAAGLAVPTMSKLAFGAVMQDFDHNGWQELLVANGHIDDVRADGIEFEMHPQLFAFNGATWDDHSQTSGEFFDKRILGRAIATADFDNDGDLDAAVVAQNSPAAMLRNDSEGGHWLNIRFIGRDSNRCGIGCRVRIQCGDRTYLQELAGGTSYFASNQPILSFGFGDCEGPFKLGVRWPNGERQVVADVAADQLFVLQESDHKAR